MPQAELERRLKFASQAARQAGEILREGLGRVKEVGLKGEVDLVTEFDLRSERALVQAIQREFPGEAILAEESGPSGEGESRWLVDPLDGTTNFAHGLPVFAVSIAWALGDHPLVGVVYDPSRLELYRAAAGGGSWLGERRLQVSDSTNLGESLLVTGFPYDVRTNPENNLDHFGAFSLRSRGVRRLGAAAIDLAYVAAGRFDGFWEFRLSPWDMAAGILLVREAGGHVTRADGGAEIFRPPTSILATNGRIHEAMLEILNLTPHPPSPEGEGGERPAIG